MGKFNTMATRPTGVGPIHSESAASGQTFEGAPGFARDAKSELFLLAVSNMVGENTFYESSGDRDSRFAGLVRAIAVEDIDWLARFAGWLRGEANMRSASLVLAAEAVKARLDANLTGSRPLVSSVLQRADEPGEMIAYWHSHHGRTLPKPLKRGIADAATRLYSERNVLKYDTDSHGVRFADVIQLCHVEPRAEWQSVLFKYVIERRLGIEGLEIPSMLEMLTENHALRAQTPQTITTWAKSGVLAEKLSAAGMTWEAVPSLVGGPWTKELWEAIIPSMGYMACLRNLRNFDQAGVSDKVAAQVVATLIDPEAVAKSRQFPMRFLSAFKAAPSLRWAWPLEQALDLSLRNIPELSGKTLIMVDTSGSMNAPFSKDGTLMRWDSATVFGLGLARRCQSSDVVSFSNRAALFPQVKGESVLKSLERWMKSGYFQNGGTYTSQALQAAFKGHDRVVILTDEQSATAWAGNPGQVIPANVPMYTWNLAGYQHGHAASGANRYAFGGLTDAGFRMITLLEQGKNADWPF